MKFVKAEVNIHVDNSQLGVINYGKDAVVVSPLSSDMKKLFADIAAMRKIGGDRRIDKALRKYIDEMLPRSSKPNAVKPLVVFLTGGNSLAGKVDLDGVLAQLKSLGVQITVVAIGDKVDKKEAEKIALGQKDNVIYVRDETQLTDVIPTLFVIIGKGKGKGSSS